MGLGWRPLAPRQEEHEACSALLTGVSFFGIHMIITPPAFSQRPQGDEIMHMGFLRCLRFPIKIYKNLGVPLLGPK